MTNVKDIIIELKEVREARIPCVSVCRKEIPTDENSRFLYWVEPQLNKMYAPGYITENSYLCELPDHTWVPMSENDYLNSKSV